MSGGMKFWYLYNITASLILGVFSVWGVIQLYEAALSYTWPHVTGTVISSVARSKLMRGRHGEFITHWPEGRYEYVVGHRRFVGDRIRFLHKGMSETETRQVVAAYPIGKSVAVYFDARNAASAVLEPGIWWVFIPILVFAIFLTLLLPAIIYADWAGQLTGQAK